MKKQKKAQGHVEVILSFVIFIGFLLFMFIFLNPFARTKESNYIMNNIQKVIINNITNEIGKLSIILNESGTCYNFSDDYGSNYKQIEEADKKYMIYFYPIFSDNTKDIDCDKGNYTLGIYSEENMIVYEKIIDLKNNYERDYEGLKRTLGITNDFLFSVRNIGFGFSNIPVIADDYISYYKFEGNSNDKANNNLGTSNNINYLIDSERGQVAEFNGINSYIDLGESRFNISNEFTISFWFKSTNMSPDQTLIERGQSHPFRVYISGSDKTIVATTSSSINSSELENNMWYHVVFTYDNDKGKLYINKNLEDNRNSMGGISLPLNKNTYIGRRPNSPNEEYFNGSIDDVMIYNRTLTADEIISIYENQKSLLPLGIDISVSRNIPQGIDVESREIPIRVINESGQIQELILNIKAW